MALKEFRSSSDTQIQIPGDDMILYFCILSHAIEAGNESDFRHRN